MAERKPRKKPTKAVVPVEPDDSAPLPWERQKGEPNKAWWAFSVYRDLGPAERSLAKVVRIAGETRVTAHIATVERWSSRWGWVDRSHAYDVDQDRKLRAETDEARASAARSRAMIGSIGLGIVGVRLRGEKDPENPAVWKVKPLDPNELDAHGVARMAEVMAKLQASGLGDAYGLAGLEPGMQAQVKGLAETLVQLGIDWIATGIARAVELNGNATPESVAALVLQCQDAMIDEAQTAFARIAR